MDFIVDFSKTQKCFDNMFVVVGRLTKVAQFRPKMTTLTTSRVVELFVEEIFVNHRLLLRDHF